MNSTIHKIYFATILVAYPLDQEFTYSFKADQMIKVGSIVQVPFRNKDYIGVVRSIQDKANFDVKKIKPIKKISNYLLNKKILKFLDWIASYNLIFKGMVLKMILPKSEAYFNDDKDFRNTIVNKNFNFRFQKFSKYVTGLLDLKKNGLI